MRIEGRMLVVTPMRESRVWDTSVLSDGPAEAGERVIGWTQFGV
jgi:hypothetical protein